VALRLVEARIREADQDALRHELEESDAFDIETHWFQQAQGGFVIAKIVVQDEAAQDLLDHLEEHYLQEHDAKAVVVEIGALLPQEEKTQTLKEWPPRKERERLRFHRSRIDTKELLEQMEGELRFTLPFLILIALSTIVAAFGLYTNSIVVIIGGMLIAPLAAPNVGLGMATTLAHLPLALRAGILNAIAIGGGILIAALMGLLLEADPTTPEIGARVTLAYPDLLVALAAGAAGVIALTTGTRAAIIGVMVAVALVPAMATTGLLLGGGQWEAALGAGLLLAANIIGINLAAVVTLYLQGVRPQDWWENRSAKKATLIAGAVWVVLLGVLVAILIYS
jgi:uncharacterized hydrophobic protein (TIGR00341 family)